MCCFISLFVCLFSKYVVVTHHKFLLESNCLVWYQWNVYPMALSPSHPTYLPGWSYLSAWLQPHIHLIPELHRPGSINNGHLFSGSSGGLKLETRCQQGWFLLGPLSLACRSCLFPVPSRGLSSMCLCVLISSSYKDSSHTGLDPTLIFSFLTYYLFKDSISNIDTFWVLGG